jgi:hypothetical protein
MFPFLPITLYVYGIVPIGKVPNDRMTGWKGKILNLGMVPLESKR